MTDFIESRLLDCVAFGTSTGPSYRTQRVQLKNARTRRNIEWDYPKYRGIVRYQNLTEDEQQLVIHAFHVCAGAAVGFRVKDYSDHTGTCVLTASATGAPQHVQLFKRYNFGSYYRTRIIRKPVAGTVQLSAITPPTGVSVDTTTGIVTFTGTIGQQVTAVYEFDIPMTFEQDELMFSVEERSGDTLLLSADVPLIEDSDA